MDVFKLNKLKAFMNWSVYIILCTGNTLYTGITFDVAKRFNLMNIWIEFQKKVRDACLPKL